MVHEARERAGESLLSVYLDTDQSNAVDRFGREYRGYAAE
jgi:hypothetical protein